MLSLLAMLLLAAAPPGPVESGWREVTFALRPPLEAGGEATFLARQPAWDQAYRFDRYALPIATATAGGDPAAQVAAVERLAERLTPDRLVLVSPTVGDAGWESSRNAGYLPVGGRGSVVATPPGEWLALVTAARAMTVALTLEGRLRDPTPKELADALDAFLAACQQAGRRAELWLPAAWLTADPRPPCLAALSAERLALVGGVTWLDAHEAATALAPVAPADPAAQVVLPTAVTRTAGLALLVDRAAAVAPLERTALDLVDSPRGPVRQAADGLAWLGALHELGVARVTVLGRLDTPQAPVWREVLAALWP